MENASNDGMWRAIKRPILADAFAATWVKRFLLDPGL